MDNSSTENFFSNTTVKDYPSSPIRIRFDSQLKRLGRQWHEVYKEIPLSKNYASMIRNGHLIPPVTLRNRIAQVMQCDTSILWEPIELVTADKLEDLK